MKDKVRGLLQKINFVETDMELQKQILFSIPADQKDEMKKVLDMIASQKQQINDLRQEIKAVDEEEYNRIITLEQATEKFRQLSRDKKFVKVHTLNEEGQCFVTLNEGTRVDCLVAAKDDNENWTVLTIDGEVREYPGGLVQE